MPNGLAMPEISAPKQAFQTDVDQEILRFAIDSHQSGIPVAICTLVAIRGGSSKALGAHMAVRFDGQYCGYVSGGCTEAAVAAEAVSAISSGADRLLKLGVGSPFFDIVFPCGGGITIAVHVLKDDAPLVAVLDRLRNRFRAGLCYDPRKQSLRVADSVLSSGWNADTFTSLYKPSARLFASGCSIELSATIKIAEAAGYEVLTHDTRSVDARHLGALDEDTAVVLLHHDLEAELPVLSAALKSNPFYIGALGSSRTHEKRVGRLFDLGFTSAAVSKIKAPIGLFGKTRDAHSLALSVVADIAVSRQLQPQA